MEKVIKDIVSKIMSNILKKLYKNHNYLPFLLKRMTIKNFEKPVANLYGKTEYVIHI